MIPLAKRPETCDVFTLSYTLLSFLWKHLEVSNVSFYELLFLTLTQPLLLCAFLPFSIIPFNSIKPWNHIQIDLTMRKKNYMAKSTNDIENIIKRIRPVSQQWTTLSNKVMNRGRPINDTRNKYFHMRRLSMQIEPVSFIRKIFRYLPCIMNICSLYKFAFSEIIRWRILAPESEYHIDL